jgi:hypothetical protein
MREDKAGWNRDRWVVICRDVFGLAIEARVCRNGDEFCISSVDSNSYNAFSAAS